MNSRADDPERNRETPKKRRSSMPSSRRRPMLLVAHLREHRVHHQQQPDRDRQRHGADAQPVEAVVDAGDDRAEARARRPSRGDPQRQEPVERREAGEHGALVGRAAAPGRSGAPREASVSTGGRISSSPRAPRAGRPGRPLRSGSDVWWPPDDRAVHAVGDLVRELDAHVLEAGRLEARRRTRRARARRRCSRRGCRARRAASGESRSSATTSLIAIRPPGRSTREVSARTAALSAERLITQFEITTSTESAGSGIASITPLRKWTLATPASRAFAPGEREHLVGHVEAVRDAGRADAARGEDHVDAAARAEVEHDLALVQLGDRGRVAAAERGGRGRLGQLAALLVGVEALAEARVSRAAGAAAAAGARRPPRGRPRRSGRGPARAGRRRWWSSRSPP